MTSKLAALSTTFVLLFSSICNASYVFVGNGGEGYASNGSLYTRDLYDYDLHMAPWFGNYADPLLSNEIKLWNPLNLTPFEVELLARKLSDLNSAQEFFGDDILLILKYFHWSFTEENLVLIEPDEIRKPIESKNRFSIANRFLNSIVINKSLFESLNSENKIALILHEAIFSVLTVRYEKSGKGVQSLGATRLIVSSLFSKEALSSLSTASLLKDRLSIATPDSSNLRTLHGVYARVRLMSRSSYTIPGLDEVFVLKQLTSNQNTIDDLCLRFFQKNETLESIEVSLSGRAIAAERYSTGENEQYALRIQNVFLPPRYIHLNTQDPRFCSYKLFEGVKRHILSPRQ